MFKSAEGATIDKGESGQRFSNLEDTGVLYCGNNVRSYLSIIISMTAASFR
jgi:hypothetical protein